MYHVMIPREGERPSELRPLRQWGLRGTLALDVGFETVLSVGFGTSGRQALGAVPSADGKRRMAGVEGGEKAGTRTPKAFPGIPRGAKILTVLYAQSTALYASYQMAAVVWSPPRNN